MTDSQRWMLLFCSIFVAALIYYLSPVLTPFLVAALLSYFFNPLVNRLVSWHLPRVLSVTIVFLFILLLVLSLFLLFIPVLEYQITLLSKRLPQMIGWLANTAWPWLDTHFHLYDKLNIDTLEKTILSHLKESGDVATKIWVAASHSGKAIIGFVTDVILIIVVSFYLLCDWSTVVEKSKQLLPRAIEKKTTQLLKDCGEVLSAFFRGQLLVMISLGIIYGTGLWLVGLDIGILIGALAGLLSIVPYLGFISGVLLSVIAAIVQFHELTPIIWVLVVFGIGEVAESFVLVPWLVGDRTGLHPVAVIFAVLVGGRLFGFVGVLLAVPVAAVILVLLKALQSRYIKSSYYTKHE